MKILIISVLLTLTCFANCAKILAVFPGPGPSHYFLGSALLKALAEKGHDVTMISCFGEKEPPKNLKYRDIVVPEIREYLQEKLMSSGQSTMFDREGTNPFLMTIFMGMMMPQAMAQIFENENVQKLIHSDEKFDVVIVEQFMNEAHKALATHFDAQLITLSSMGANFWINSITGNPSPLSYIPDLMLDYSESMSFCERILNTVLYVWNVLYFNIFVYPLENEIIKKYIPNAPDINDVLYNNSSIVLMNSHPSLNQPVPYVPNMIEIGGFHVKPPKKLPQDLQEYLDNAKEGVIYFSMGSNLRSAEFPPEKRDAMLKAFSKLKENVLWKWEDDVLPGQPSNVKLGKWLPQQDILAHPNVKLFITHGGFLSTTETTYHGVPILAIPIFGDQKLNAKRAVDNGVGLMLPYSEISEEKFTNNIRELLNNPKYRNNAKQRSEIFRDRLVSPMETAIYWVEYVVRHKGAPHLRVAGLDLPWYKYYLLDVVGFLILITLTSTFVFCYSCKFVCRKLCKKGKQQSKKLKKT